MLPPDRPSVDVVVPFAGSAAALERLLQTLAGVALGAGDSMVVVDNGPPSPDRRPRAFGERRRVIVETRLPSSYYARNHGAQEGSAEWLLFVDADTEPPAGLLDAYFAEPVAGDVGVLAGGVIDEVSGAAGWRQPAARYTDLRASMSQANTMTGEWAYAQTANAAVRRTAFEEAGGFVAIVRSGGDADLCFRLRRAGWGLEAREAAAVVHRSRPTLRAMLRQRARHGSGARWLNGCYPGAFPPRISPGLVVWASRQGGSALAALVRRDPDAAILLGVDVLSLWAFELGRLFPNHVRSRGGS